MYVLLLLAVPLASAVIDFDAPPVADTTDAATAADSAFNLVADSSAGGKLPSWAMPMQHCLVPGERTCSGRPGAWVGESWSDKKTRTIDGQRGIAIAGSSRMFYAKPPKKVDKKQATQWMDVEYEKLQLLGKSLSFTIGVHRRHAAALASCGAHIAHIGHVLRRPVISSMRLQCGNLCALHFRPAYAPRAALLTTAMWRPHPAARPQPPRARTCLGARRCHTPMPWCPCRVLLYRPRRHDETLTIGLGLLRYPGTPRLCPPVRQPFSQSSRGSSRECTCCRMHRGMTSRSLSLAQSSMSWRVTSRLCRRPCTRRRCVCYVATRPAFAWTRACTARDALWACWSRMLQGKHAYDC